MNMQDTKSCKAETAIFIHDNFNCTEENVVQIKMYLKYINAKWNIQSGYIEYNSLIISDKKVNINMCVFL